MIKLKAAPEVLAALAQAFPPPSSDAARALDKYIAVLERLLFLCKRSINPVLPLSS